MSSIRETAEQFFDACETGKGWEGCQAYCHEGATFSAQAGALQGVETVEGYADWMKGTSRRCQTPATRFARSRWMMRGRTCPPTACFGEHIPATAGQCRRRASRWRRITCTSWISTAIESVT